MMMHIDPVRILGREGSRREGSREAAEEKVPSSTTASLVQGLFPRFRRVRTAALPGGRLVTSAWRTSSRTPRIGSRVMTGKFS
jgi:hypothetical protein